MVFLGTEAAWKFLLHVFLEQLFHLFILEWVQAFSVGHTPLSKDIRICNVPCLRPWVRGWIPSPKGGRMQQMSWKVRVLAERCGQKWVNFGHQKDVLWIYPGTQKL